MCWYLGPHSDSVIRVWVLIYLTSIDVIKVASHLHNCPHHVVIMDLVCVLVIKSDLLAVMDYS